MMTWAKANILKWTVCIAFVSFLFGPFIQSYFTDWLQVVVGPKRGIEVIVCTPLRNATLLVSSSDGQTSKTHSAGHYPFLQQAKVIVVNHSEVPVPNSSVFVAPLNISSNHLAAVNFYSDNNVSKNEYFVEELAGNAFHIQLGNFASKQILVLEFVTLLPTSFVVEFGGETQSKKRVVNAGYCDEARGPNSLALPVDFYAQDDFPNNSDERLFGKIEDISDPIGLVSFDVVLDYDCGSGLERQTIPMGGAVEYCNIRLNMTPDG
ncbi:hypothetical protein SAMN05444273_103199 [Litoreibacter ascidiaceicola]|uniref:Uncharacterized protein n=1 Tax=Litoreibacter ascidiaceicola TaxID=1486859 RepID=A0A1M4XJM4_9RHOB|nr:hypothetical protein [Litoreibacter ascidiaceicola]SHE93600.1 hypothetical protein SAMN05444273_103199 [Litoreibacter ascidiaceicola]